MPNRKRPTYTPPPPRPWAEVREISLQRAAERERDRTQRRARLERLALLYQGLATMLAFAGLCVWALGGELFPALVITWLALLLVNGAVIALWQRR